MQKELKQKDLIELRKNNTPKICPICGRKITFEESVVDHIHSKHKTIYPQTYSLVREVICRNCNIILGKVENIYLRMSKDYKDNTKLSKILINMAKYIEKYSDIKNFDEKLIHPSEVKSKKIKKSFFNKLQKMVKEKYNKEIKYPKFGKLTKEIKKYCDLLNINVEYY